MPCANACLLTQTGGAGEQADVDRHPVSRRASWRTHATHLAVAVCLFLAFVRSTSRESRLGVAGQDNHEVDLGALVVVPVVPVVPVVCVLSCTMCVPCTVYHVISAHTIVYMP